LHRDRGLSLRRLGRWEEAVQAFQKSLELDPLNGDAASTLVETLVIMNAWDRVELLADSWLLKVPDSGDFLNYKARAMVNGRGEVDQAWALLAPVSDVSGSRLGGTRILLASMRGDWAQATELASDEGVEGFLEIFERTPDLRAGEVYAMKGDAETARDYFADYIAYTNETDTNGRLGLGLRHTNLAEVYAWLGDNDLARRHAEIAAEAIPLQLDHVFGANVDRRLTWVMARTGDRDLALERLAAKLDQPEGFSRWELYLDPAWDFFRDDARFNALALPEGIEPEPFRQQRLGDGT
jgi:tetratricopeptide (TPR) repeat protein